MPSTEASDQPRKMKVMARPRSAGGVSSAMADAACGVKAAAPSIVRQRSASSVPKLGIRALSRWPAANHSSASTSRRRRSQPLSSPASSGEPKAMTIGRRTDELAAQRHRHLQRAHDVVEHAGGDHHAAADGKVAGQQRPAWRRVAAVQRSTFSASGLTMFVGLLLTKLTTLSKAALKYSS